MVWTDARSGVDKIYAQGGRERSLRLGLDLPSSERVSVEVLDPSGRRVRTLLAGASLDAGTHAITWVGADDGGARVPPGLFFVRVRAGAEALSRRIVRLQ